jgi:phosphoglycolate phosphatase-like HAD superfamily hydrolase
VALVNYGYNHGEPVASAAPDAIVGSISELASLLRAG